MVCLTPDTNRVEIALPAAEGAARRPFLHGWSRTARVFATGQQPTAIHDGCATRSLRAT